MLLAIILLMMSFTFLKFVGGIYFPVQSVGSSRWYLQGLVSVGVGAQDGSNKCDPTRFSIFTRISPYADWIVRVLSERDAL